MGGRSSRSRRGSLRRGIKNTSARLRKVVNKDFIKVMKAIKNIASDDLLRKVQFLAEYASMIKPQRWKDGSKSDRFLVSYDWGDGISYPVGHPGRDRAQAKPGEKVRDTYKWDFARSDCSASIYFR